MLGGHCARAAAVSWRDGNVTSVHGTARGLGGFACQDTVTAIHGLARQCFRKYPAIQLCSQITVQYVDASRIRGRRQGSGLHWVDRNAQWNGYPHRRSSGKSSIIIWKMSSQPEIPSIRQRVAVAVHVEHFGLDRVLAQRSHAGPATATTPRQRISQPDR
jgi:hypothetical protein